MPRDPLAWLPLLQHWTRCLGEGGEAISRLGELSALPDLDMAALLPGGPGWTDVQRSLRHDPEGAFRLLYYGLALRGLEALPASELLVPPDSLEPPQVTVLIPVHNHWAITLNALRSLVAMANGTSFEVIVADDASSDAGADARDPLVSSNRSGWMTAGAAQADYYDYSDSRGRMPTSVRLDPVTARKDDAPAADQAAITNVVGLRLFSGGGELI